MKKFEELRLDWIIPITSLIFLTTHNLDEAVQLCDRIGILNNGRILTIDSPDRLKNAMVENFLYILFITFFIKPQLKWFKEGKKSCQSNW